MTIIQITATAIPAAILALSAIGKIAGAKQLVETFKKMNIERHLKWIGIMELSIAVLYSIPYTMNVGFFIACSHVGGATVAHLTIKDKPTHPIVILIILWVAMYFRNPQLFTF